MKNIEELVRENYENLNENDLQIWNYITQHKQKCSDIRIEQLSDICHVSRTSILRFTKKISLQGFTELKFMLKQDLENHHQLTNMHIEELNHIHNQSVNIIKDYNFEDACEILANSRNIFLYGIGEVFSGVMQILKSNLFLMNCIANPIQGIGEMEFVVSRIGTNDAVILFTMSGKDQVTINFAKQLRDRGCKVITICGNRYGDINGYSDLCYSFLPIPQKIEIESDEYIPNSLLFYLIELLFFKYAIYIQRH